MRKAQLHLRQAIVVMLLCRITLKGIEQQDLSELREPTRSILVQGATVLEAARHLQLYPRLHEARVMCGNSGCCGVEWELGKR